MTHTPGPWIVDTQEDVKDRPYNVGTLFYNIADVGSKEDAHLIAAAPVMLEALKDLYVFADGLRQEWEDDNPGREYNPFRMKHLMAAKQAIAQAEGKV